LSEALKILKSTIGKLKQAESQLRSQPDMQEAGTSSQSQKRKREGKDPEVDEALLKWLTLVTGRGVSVSGPMLQTKAEELTKKLGHKDFEATEGLLTRWKTRHDVKFKRFHGEKASADKVEADKYISERPPGLLSQFSPEDIYNCDGTGLYFRATPDGSLCFREKKLAGSKKVMQRISVLLCVNMTGSDKRKPLVIGKSANPRCFKNINKGRLPVDYCANSKAWMTSLIFLDWLKRWDAELTQAGGKVLLFLDKCSAHPKEGFSLRNITLKFLPQNTTSLAQPLDTGIIENLKVKYRGKIVLFILEKIEDQALDKTSSAKDISKKINVLEAITFLADSWKEVTQTTIRNCFGHAGFKIATEEDESMETESSQVEEDELANRIQNHQGLQSLEEEIPCHADLESEDLDQVVLESIKNKEENESDNEDKPDPPVKLREA